MNRVTELSTATSELTPVAGPSMALAAVDLACTAAGLLLGQSHDVPLLGCSAAVVSLDAAYAELRPIRGGDEDASRRPLVRETPDDPAAVVGAVINLVTATAEALRRITANTGNSRIALACSRAVLQLDMAVRFLNDDLP